MNITPDELESTPLHKVQDWLTIFQYEAQLAPKPKDIS